MSVALFVVDMQNDFCLPSSKLCVAGAATCIPFVKEAVETARSKHMHVVWIIREHDPAGVDVEWFRQHLYTNGAGSTLPGSDGVKLVDGLDVRHGEHVIVKKRFSGFFHTHLDLVLRRLGVKEIVICGVQTPNCIRATAVDGMALDYKVVVLSDATASKSDAVQEANLEDMRCMSIATPTTAGWKATLA